MTARMSAVAVVVIFTACGGGTSSPTTPSTNMSSPPTTPSASSPNTGWSVTQRFVSVNGPDNCYVRLRQRELTGLVFPNVPMGVTRSGGSITLQSSFFPGTYVGTYSDSAFSAELDKPLEVGTGAACDGTIYQQMPGVSNVSGRFSADDQSLTATEANTYLLTSGEPVTYTWDWQATRRPGG
jgi:hypothetical protein